MPTVAIEVVDAGLVPVRDGTVAAPSPGVALLDPAGVVVGEEEVDESTDSNYPQHNPGDVPQGVGAPLGHYFGNSANSTQIGSVRDKAHQQRQQEQNGPDQCG